MAEQTPQWVKALSRDPLHRWLASEWKRAASNEGARFDERTAERAVEFFPKFLRLTTGRWTNRPFTLAPWQAAIVRMLFGWKRADGLRLFRRVIVWVARKNGKSEFAAGLMLLALMFDGELGGEAYCIAATERQARIVFDRATKMVQLSPTLVNEYGESIFETMKTSIFCTPLGAVVRPLTGKAQGKHGLSCSILVGDEMHEWKDGDLYEFVHQSELSRDQPLEILISTAGQARKSHGWVLWEESQKIADGTFDVPATLVVTYAPEPGDDWRDPETWAKANPNLGNSVKLEDLQDEFNKAMNSPRVETNFKRYHCDLWVGQDERWLSSDAWREGSGKPTLSKDARWRSFARELKGRECFGALDLSSVGDITCLLWLFPPPPGTGEKWLALPRFWVPTDNIEKRSRQDRVPYDVWRDRGAIEPTIGNVVDYDVVIAAVHEGLESFAVQRIGYDPYNATATVNTLTRDGVPMMLMRQGVQTLSGASKQLERLILCGQVDAGGHPVLDWMVANVAKYEDNNGNIKPDKAKSSEKIDGVSCLVMAVGLAEAESEKEYQVIVI